MATTQILLREEVDNLGGRGDIVKVRSGYARNFLLPRGLAVEATASNLKAIERERAALLKRAEAERSDAQSRADRMTNLTLTFVRRVGEHGLLYGSVTTMDIAEELNSKGMEVDRRRVVLREPIKETGEYEVTVRLHKDVIVTLPVRVVGEGEENQTPNANTANAAVETADGNDNDTASPTVA